MYVEFEIVNATIDLADTIGYIHATAWHQAYEGIVPDAFLNLFTPANRAASFRKNAPIWDAEAYLFMAEEQAAGLAFLTKDHEETAAENSGEISAIYFLSDYWGTEYTHKAMDFCIERLKELGYKSISIWVLEDNIRARRFYEKYGFGLSGATKEIHLGNSLSEVQYKRTI